VTLIVVVAVDVAFVDHTLWVRTGANEAPVPYQLSSNALAGIH
jgi:hypothetical protein